jgi:hypothetical protein
MEAVVPALSREGGEKIGDRLDIAEDGRAEPQRASVPEDDVVNDSCGLRNHLHRVPRFGLTRIAAFPQ